MKLLNKKKLYIAISIFILIAILGLLLGFLIIKDDKFVITFFISYPFMIIVYITLLFINKNFDNTQKGKLTFLVSTIIRWLSIILSLGFSLLYLYLVDSFNAPSIYYIFISPVLFTIGNILGMTLKG